MKNVIKILSCTIMLILGLAAMSATTQAATFSSTKVEVLYGTNFKRGPGFSEVNEATFTLANATGFKWGDSFFFLDTTNADDIDETGGTHFEFGPRYRFWKSSDDGLIKAVYAIVQLDFDSNRFSQKISKMAGVSLDWNAPGWKFVKTHFQYRDDPTLEGQSAQFNLVWNKGFTIGGEEFSFEGFADWTSNEGRTVTNFHTQPQVLWHVSQNIGVGIEYIYWKNRLGIKGLTEKAPQAMVRWTF